MGRVASLYCRYIQFTKQINIMRHFLFTFAMLLIGIGASAQEREQNIVEVIGYASREVVPDEFTLSITIVERDNRVKNSLEEQEREIIKALNNIGVDTSKAFTLKNNYSTNERRNTAMATRDYELVVKGSDMLNRAFAVLEELKPWSLALTGARCTNVDTIYRELRKEAIRNARERAEDLATAIDQSVGKCVYISDYTTSGSLDFYVARPNAKSAMRESANAIEESYVSPVEYSSRQLSHSLSAKFELL